MRRDVQRYRRLYSALGMVPGLGTEALSKLDAAVTVVETGAGGVSVWGEVESAVEEVIAEVERTVQGGGQAVAGGTGEVGVVAEQLRVSMEVVEEQGRVLREVQKAANEGVKKDAAR